MQVVEVASNFSIVLPEEVRQDLHLHPGDKVAFLKYGGTTRLVPAVHISELRGKFPGLSEGFERDRNDRY